jgi:carotenoid cleavage dioxygenase-like enzyme
MSTAISHTSGTDASLGFTSLDEETALESLPVSGSVPPWLGGALVRVTPAKLEVGERRLNHWFDGLAMLNRFGFRDGRVSYASRFLRTRAHEAAQEGRWRGSGFAQDPCRTLFKRVQSVFSPEFTDNANVNLVRIGERYIAMTETPLPVQFDPQTLETLGTMEYADSLSGQVTTAHPHHDRDRDELVNYVCRMSRTSEYVVTAMPARESGRREVARMPVKEPSYMHAFGMSERYVILGEHPLRVNPLKLALSGRPFIENYTWRAGEPARFQVLDRETGSLRGTYETDGFFSFHHVNAFERGASELVVDLIAYEDASIIQALYLDESGVRGALPPTELRRYVIDLGGGGVRREEMPDAGSVELPRIDYARHNTRDYRYAYFTGSDGAWIDRLVKVDVAAGTVSRWSEAGCFPGEPIFVREPGAEAEDAGVVLSVVLDSAAGRSFLLVLDAGSFEELARAEAPHHIPFGFHGQYLR